MITTGMKRLAIECAMSILAKRVKAGGVRDQAIAITAALSSVPALSETYAIGLRMAKDAVTAVRGANDYDEAVHGGTDDEIADHILAKVDASRKARAL